MFLEKEMATQSSTLAWKIRGLKSLVGYSPWGRKESDKTERLHFHFYTEWSKPERKHQFSILMHTANIRWIIEKVREFQKNIYFCFIDYAKALDCVDHNKL